LSDDRLRAVTIDEILFFHDDVIALDGGAPGIRDRGSLEAAVARPQTSFGGIELFPTPFAKAAALMESIIQRHPFVDGNKRTGLKASVFFLYLSGYEPAASPQELRDIALEVAEHRVGTASLARWLEEHTLSNEKPLNQMLLDLDKVVLDAMYLDDNTGQVERISNLRSQLEAAPTKGPKVTAEVDDRGVYTLTTLEEGYSAGLVGLVYEDMGEDLGGGIT
jgi:death-on-curing protein